MRIHRWYAVLSVSLVATAVALLGCVEPPPSDKPAGDGANVEAGYKSSIVVASPADAQTLDPGQMTDFESAQIIDLVCDRLLDFDDDSLKIHPSLADRYEVEDEGVTWRLHIRQGVKFHDGTPLDAAAVALNLGRFMALSTDDNPYYIPHMPYRESLFTDFVESIKATSDEEVVIRLKKPYVAFAANLATFPASIISPAALAKYGPDIARNPVGTGPYKFVRWVSNSEIYLTANEDYWGEKPATPELYFKVLADPNQLYNALLLGEADMIKGIETKYLETLRTKPDVDVLERPHLVNGYFGVNNSLDKFKDKRVRQALNYALNKQYICSKLYDNTSIPAHGALPPGMMGALPDPVYPYNPEKAKELLAEAGYGPDNKLSFTVTTYAQPRSYNPAGDKLALVAEQDWEKVGIDVDVKLVDWAKFLKDRVSGDYEIGNVGWGSDNGDPDNTIYQLFGAQPNNLRFVHEPSLELLLKAQVEPDLDKRRDLYEQANRLIIDEAPIVFVNHSQQIVAVRKGLEGFDLHPTAIHKFAKARMRK